jgi:hypothetical protein
MHINHNKENGGQTSKSGDDYHEEMKEPISRLAHHPNRNLLLQVETRLAYPKQSQDHLVRLDSWRS